jgi:hypothetical protein
MDQPAKKAEFLSDVASILPDFFFCSCAVEGEEVLHAARFRKQVSGMAQLRGLDCNCFDQVKAEAQGAAAGLKSNDNRGLASWQSIVSRTPPCQQQTFIERKPPGISRSASSGLLFLGRPVVVAERSAFSLAILIVSGISNHE